VSVIGRCVAPLSTCWTRPEDCPPRQRQLRGVSVFAINDDETIVFKTGPDCSRCQQGRTARNYTEEGEGSKVRGVRWRPRGLWGGMSPPYRIGVYTVHCQTWYFCVKMTQFEACYRAYKSFTTWQGYVQCLFASACHAPAGCKFTGLFAMMTSYGGEVERRASTEGTQASYPDSTWCELFEIATTVQH